MREVFTKKIYYKRFNHRLAIKCRHDNKDVKAPTPEIIEWLMNRKFQAHWRGMASSSFTGTWNWNQKPSKNLYTVFFTDPQVLEYLEKSLGSDYLEEYERPMNSKHTQMLEEEKVITRSSLFHGTYRIAIRVSAKKSRDLPGCLTDHLVEMRQWCASQFGDEADNQDIYRTYIWTNGTFYFARPKDAIMFKMVFSEYIGGTERIVLLDEV
jgi:hypothetical protein